MDAQYEEFSRLRFSAILVHREHFDKQVQVARKFKMDANSFVVSLRRRGFHLALEDMGIQRTLIDEHTAGKDLITGQLDLFPAQRIDEVKLPESRWSTAVSR